MHERTGAKTDVLPVWEFDEKQSKLLQLALVQTKRKRLQLLPGQMVCVFDCRQKIDDGMDLTTVTRNFFICS